MLRFRSASVYLSFSVSMFSSVFAFDIHPFSLRLYFSLSSIALQVTSRILLIVHCLKFSAYLADSACIPMCMWVSLSLPLSISLVLTTVPNKSHCWCFSVAGCVPFVCLSVCFCILQLLPCLSNLQSFCMSVRLLYVCFSLPFSPSLSFPLNRRNRQTERDR